MSATVAPVADRVLPQLQIVQDTLAMRHCFQSLFEQYEANQGNSVPAFDIVDCRIAWSKYRPGHDCRQAYELDVLDKVGNRITQRLYTRIYPTGQALSRFQRAEQEWNRRAGSQSTVAPAYGPPVAFLPELEMVAWGFPYDRKLVGLPVLMDGNEMARRLAVEVHTRFGIKRDVLLSSHRIIHYVPEHTCTIVIKANVAPSPDELVTLYGKCYFSDEGRDTFRVMQALDHRSEPELADMASPWCYWDDCRILLQRELSGRSFAQLRDCDALKEIHLRRAAQAISSLHTLQVDAPWRDARSHLLRRLSDVESMLTTVHPELLPAYRTVRDRLHDSASAGTSFARATVHGDLHWKNLLVDASDRVGMIDLDNLHLGDPIYDVGSLIAGLICQECMHPGFSPMPANILQFLHVYESGVPWPVSGCTLRWFLAACLISERVYRSITRLKSGRLEIVAALIECAARLLQLNQTTLFVPANSRLSNGTPQRELHLLNAILKNY